jgi:DNA adenine methylase
LPSAATIYLSPLRYPGGKARLAPFVSELLRNQHPRPRRYVEPFAGGAGVGLRLLYDEHVDEIVINDLNPGIAAFWRSVFDSPEEFMDLIRRCKPSIDVWYEQQAVYDSAPDDDLALGFATFFLNRTNRSGILGARPIGGLDQTGRWKIDARWNADKLAARIDLLAPYASRVEIRERDALDLLSEVLRDPETFVYADPPYVVQGDELYLDTLRWEDHQRLSGILRGSRNWFLTYDADERVLDLYRGLRCVSFGIAHTAATQHIGREFGVFADALNVSSLEALGRGGDAAWLDSTFMPAPS